MRQSRDGTAPPRPLRAVPSGGSFGEVFEKGGFAVGRWVALFAALLMFTPFAALAQTSPVQVRFVGTITSSASETLMIRTADGSNVPWTGPMPDYPYVAGDQVTISFNAIPTGEYLDPSYPRQPADGIYRFQVTGRSQGATASTGVAALAGMDVSGPIGASGQWESARGLVLTYNSNTGTWGMEMPTGTYTLSEFNGPGFLYDRGTNTLTGSNTTAEPRYGCGEAGAGCFNIAGTMNSGSFQAPVWGTDGSLAGLFSMLFSGSWFVNGQQVGGGATDVPEPGQTSLFALALVAVMLRTRRRPQAAQG